MRVSWRRACTATVAVLLAAFFSFVGWNKAFAALADLARYGAWTVWLPEWLGRLVGWSEMACAVALLGVLVPGRERIARAAAAILAANQVVAATMHLVHAEFGALPQNAVLVALLLGIVLAAAKLTQRTTHSSSHGVVG
jgi:hypothetical protein